MHVSRDSDAKIDGKGDTKSDAKGDVKAEAASAGTASPAPDAEKSAAAKMSTRKMYYLSCLACRWTSRDVGLPDQTMGMNAIISRFHDLSLIFDLCTILAAGNWPEIEYANATRFSKLMEYFQDVVLVEKQEKQDYSRRMTPKKHKFASLTVRISDIFCDIK